MRYGAVRDLSPGWVAIRNHFAIVGLRNIGGNLAVGKKFCFWNGPDAIMGTVIGVSTSDDGYPFLEVSNRRFAGLEVRGILLLRDGGALLNTTATEPGYGRIPGTLDLFD
jgi:hypothetical protein